MTAKEECLKFIFENEFITKPRLKNEFELLLNKVIDESKQHVINKEKLIELLKIAYRWGLDNGSNRSDKNFNDLLQTSSIRQSLLMTDVLGQSEQLVCKKCGNAPVRDEVDWCDNCLNECF